MKNKKYISFLMAFAIAASAIITNSASAATVTPAGSEWNGAGHARWTGAPGMRMGMGQEIFGTVSSISGNTVTVNVPARKDFGTSTVTKAAAVYTVDASSATVYKDNSTSSVSLIVSGDSVMVQGTITGTNVVAKIIRDGKMPMGGAAGFQRGDRATSTEPMVSGDGNPVVAGTVSTVSGNTITLKNNSNTEFTIDITKATIKKGDSSSSVSNISVGDNILVQGTVNGNSIVATLVIDQSVKPAVSAKAGGIKGFFGNIGGFFKHLFGF